MVRLSAAPTLAVCFGLLVGCEAASPGNVGQDLESLTARADRGVAAVLDALEDPSGLSGSLGAGIEEVSRATRGLARIADLPELSPEHRLSAGLQEARAWDDVARALEGAVLVDPDRPELERLYHELLQEKAFPARIAARNAYERALRLACRLASEEHPAVLEAVDGIERYGGQVPVSDRVCSMQ